MPQTVPSKPTKGAVDPTVGSTLSDLGYDREIRSQTLDTVVTPGMGEIQAANFGGGVRFVDDPTNATAPDLQYNVAKGTARLVAASGGAGAIVTDDNITIEARQIDLTLDGKGLVADQDVRSVLKATRGRPARDACGPIGSTLHKRHSRHRTEVHPERQHSIEAILFSFSPHSSGTGSEAPPISTRYLADA